MAASYSLDKPLVILLRNALNETTEWNRKTSESEFSTSLLLYQSMTLIKITEYSLLKFNITMAQPFMLEKSIWTLPAREAIYSAQAYYGTMLPWVAARSHRVGLDTGRRDRGHRTLISAKPTWRLVTRSAGRIGHLRVAHRESVSTPKEVIKLVKVSDQSVLTPSIRSLNGTFRYALLPEKPIWWESGFKGGYHRNSRGRDQKSRRDLISRTYIIHPSSLNRHEQFSKIDWKK